MTELNEEILKFLEENSTLDSLEYAEKHQLDHQKVVGSIKSLQVNEGLIEVEQKTQKAYQLNSEAQEFIKNGSYEANIFSQIPDDGISQAEIMKLPNAKLGFAKAMTNGWVALDKATKTVKKQVASVEDEVQTMLKKISALDLADVQEKSIQDLKKRKLITEQTVNSFNVKKGPNFSTKLEKLEVELTPEMLQNNAWKNIKFKELNINAMGVQPSTGHLHPLLKVRTEFRKIFIEMGFTEMPTNNYIENSFWNFDALFVPQKHPARDAQDTFFISDPAICTQFPADYLERVKNAHINGQGCDSQGYQYDWKFEETQKNVLRTHTTAVSARMLFNLAKQEVFKPAKFFSIDKVFRNETLDATHLAEFHQIEGVIADKNLSLGELIGVFKVFFAKLGMNDLRFKPAYNPYTEPSLEIFAYHKGLKKWVEVGNSGVFRPEMLLPMNLPKDVIVFGWGLSLERPTMIKYGINNIRDLVGHKVNLQMVYENPICRIKK